MPLPKGGYIQFPADGEREGETLSRNNGRHSVSGKAKKEGKGLVKGEDDIILGYVELHHKSNQHMHAQQRRSLSYKRNPQRSDSVQSRLS